MSDITDFYWCGKCLSGFSTPEKLAEHFNGCPDNFTEVQRGIQDGNKTATAIRHISEANAIEHNNALEALCKAEYDLMKAERQLHTARYSYHCQIKHKYLVMSVLPPEQAAEMYRLAMENYDSLIAEAVNGHLTEANRAEMDKGVGA